MKRFVKTFANKDIDAVDKEINQFVALESAFIFRLTSAISPNGDYIVSVLFEEA